MHHHCHCVPPCSEPLPSPCGNARRHQAEIQAEAKKRVAAMAWTGRGADAPLQARAVVQRATAGGSAACTKDDVNTPCLSIMTVWTRNRNCGRQQHCKQGHKQRTTAGCTRQTAKAIPGPLKSPPLHLCPQVATWGSATFDPVGAPVRTTASSGDARLQRRLLKRQQRKDKERQLRMAAKATRGCGAGTSDTYDLNEAESVGDLDDWESGEFDDVGQGRCAGKDTGGWRA